MKKILALSLLIMFSVATEAWAAVTPIPPANAPAVASIPGTAPAAYTQAVKTLQENKYGENEIKSFVYQVFSMFDRHPEVNQLLLMFADEDLDMRLPEGSIKSHKEFEKWYAGIGARYQSNLHFIEKIEVSVPAKGEYRASFVVNWQAVGRDGKYSSLKFRQTWKIVDGGSYWPRIVSYVVEPAL